MLYGYTQPSEQVLHDLLVSWPHCAARMHRCALNNTHTKNDDGGTTSRSVERARALSLSYWTYTQGVAANAFFYLYYCILADILW